MKPTNGRAATWKREDLPDRAAAKILDAAGRAFAEVGVSAAGMDVIAKYAGCSRGTLYVHFKDRHDLHLAYVDREARTIMKRVRRATAQITDPRQRLIKSIVLSIREVRRNPGTAAWFSPGVSDYAARMSRASDIVETFTAKFASELMGGGCPTRDSRQLARWIVRVIVSFLTMPGESEKEERTMIERFVVPIELFGGLALARPAPPPIGAGAA